MFFFFPFGGGGGGRIFFWIIVITLIVRVFRFLKGGNSSSYRSQFYSRPYSSGVPANKEYFVGMFSMLAKLASADGNVSEKAKARINSFMVNELNLDNNTYQYARNIFNSALTSSDTFESLADRFYGNFATSPGILQMTLDMFYSIAMTDGHVSRREESMLEYAAKRFNIPQSIIDSIKRKYGVSTTSSSKAYAVLGVSENASVDEIKKAYRKLIMEFHPDRVSASGAGEEFKQYAVKRFREIQEAYEQICKEKGIK